jgi:hypothetical protein
LGNQLALGKKLNGVGLVAGNVKKEQVGDNPLNVRNELNSAFTKISDNFKRKAPQLLYCLEVG